MTKEHTNVKIVPGTRCDEIINEAIYAKWTKMTKQFTDESDKDPLTAQEYCRYIQDII